MRIVLAEVTLARNLLPSQRAAMNVPDREIPATERQTMAGSALRDGKRLPFCATTGRRTP